MFPVEPAAGEEEILLDCGATVLKYFGSESTVGLVIVGHPHSRTSAPFHIRKISDRSQRVRKRPILSPVLKKLNNFVEDGTMVVLGDPKDKFRQRIIEELNLEEAPACAIFTGGRFMRCEEAAEEAKREGQKSE